MTQPLSISAAGSVGVPAPVLENLAARMRQCGLFLTLLRSDGSLAYHDPSTEPFFLKFVLPAMQGDPGSRPPLAEPAAAMNPASPIALWSMIPGVIIAAVPHVERRAIRGIFAIAAKAHTFRQNDELLRFCERAGVDSTWLQHQADVVPSYGEESLQRQARLFLGMVRDQLRLASLEQELEMLSAQLANSYEELSLIYQLSGGMKVNRSAGDFFRQACLDVMQVMDIRAMGVVLRGDGGLDQPPAVYGSIDLPRSTLERLADHLLEFFSHRPGPLQVNQIEKDRHLSFLSAHARQLLAVPLVRGQQVLGCLFALDKNHDEFNSVDSKLLTSISNESAVYLENAMLFEDVHGLMMGLLHSLTSAVDAKDAYTCGHSERVALLSRQLALAAGLPEPEADRVYMAGLLHDVGKIGVPEAVLQKAGRLTPEEFDQIKKHPEIGARILRDIRQIEDIIPGVLHHHERYDGKGYPAGLAGEDIPRMGRIICLADCFDAMTSSRTYRKALPLEVAMTEIHRCAGTQFDPRLADAFLKLSTAELRDMLKNHSVAARTLLDLQQSIRSAA